MQISKWGNSLAIRLPSAVVEALQLEEGDDIEVIVANENTFGVRKKPTNRASCTCLLRFTCSGFCTRKQLYLVVV